MQIANALRKMPIGRIAFAKDSRRMLASPLMDANGFARDVEAAYRLMWGKWCETLQR